MSYLEKQQGIESGEDYSPTFLELDAESGPWLVKVQQESVTGRYPNWDLNAETGVITFGDDERTGVVASVQILGTYSADDNTWLWGWSSPEMGQQSAATAGVRDNNPDIPELTTPTFKCSETKAWSLSAAAAYAMQADTCYRLPGEIIVNVFEDGSVVVNQQRLDDDALMALLSRIVKLFPGQPVLIRADKATDYEHVIRILDLCRKVDIWNISFATTVSE